MTHPLITPDSDELGTPPLFPTDQGPDEPTGRPEPDEDDTDE